MKYTVVNNVVGWIVFAIAAATYMFTAESSASLWDCGEFIAAADKLQVVHPPGAPLFLMIGRLFAIVAPSQEMVPVMMNYFSALSTAFAVLFLFWIITMLARKLILKANEEATLGQTIAIMGAGLVGALAATFSETMWFSAVEGEVYALSTFFIAIVLWAMMKWEANADKQGGDRWLIMIAFLVGLSIGVHLLSLLVIPITVLVYYFKRFKVTLLGSAIALVTGFVILSLVQTGVIQIMTARAANNELMLINNVGLPFNTGILLYYLIVFVFIGSLIFVSRKEKINLAHLIVPFSLFYMFLAPSIVWGAVAAVICLVLFLIFKYAMNIKDDLQSILMAFGLILPGYLVWMLIQKSPSALRGKIENSPLNGIVRERFELFGLAFLFILIGFSSYVMIPIRSAANTPINMNAPKDAFSLLSYLNREQYGERPLIYGPLYDAQAVAYSEKEELKYYPDKETGKYLVKAKKRDILYKSEDKVFFPRLYSPDPAHVQMYQQWLGERFTKPTQSHNFAYFFKYQIGYMYMRYFMWNFAGRQDDIQGLVSNKMYHGNWLSGIPFLDDARLGGGQADLPQEMKDHKARNKFYLLPLIFGLLGLIYLSYKNERWAFVYFFLFILTGVMLIVYFNSPPREPRERDYTLVGSFYTFCVFIGLGVLFLYEQLKKFAPSTVSAIVATLIGVLAVPVIMASNGYDDHNRKDRRMARDFAINFLESCPPNAILFTQGDNDTYPLWYVQEVEGVRPDVRVTNLSLIGVDWYLEFLQKAANENQPLPFIEAFNPDTYRGDNNNQVFYKQRTGANEYIDLDKVLEFVLDGSKQELFYGEKRNYFPTNKAKIAVDKSAVLANNVVPAKYADQIVDEIRFDIPFEGRAGGQYVIKNNLAVLALIAGMEWDRPICFANTVSPESYMGLEQYLIQEGMMYRLVPVKFALNSARTGQMEMNTDAMYERLMNNYQYGGLDEKEHFIDENTHRLMHGLRNVHLALADQLQKEGKTEKSLAVLERMKEKFPNMNAPYYSVYNALYPGSLYSYNNVAVDWVELYYKNGKPELAKEITEVMLPQLADSWRFYNSTSTFAKNFQGNWDERDFRHREKAIYNIQRLSQVAEQYKDDALFNQLSELFPDLVKAKIEEPLNELELQENN
jgi:hypothetical protein